MKVQKYSLMSHTYRVRWSKQRSDWLRKIPEFSRYQFTKKYGKMVEFDHLTSF